MSSGLRGAERSILILSPEAATIVAPRAGAVSFRHATYDRFDPADVAGALLLEPWRSEARGDQGADALAAAPEAVDRTMDRLWAALNQLFVTMHSREGGGQVLIELPAVPWDDEASIADTMVTHAIVGLLRALSADDGRDNVRFNGFVRRGAPAAAVDALTGHLLSEAAAATNGQVFALEGDALALAGMESPRWQIWCDGREPGWEGLISRAIGV